MEDNKGENYCRRSVVGKVINAERETEYESARRYRARGKFANFAHFAVRNQTEPVSIAMYMPTRSVSVRLKR